MPTPSLVSKLRRKVRSGRALSGAQRRLFVRAACLLTLTCLGLRLCGFRRWQRLTERSSARRGPVSAEPPADEAIAAIRCTLHALRLAVRYSPLRGNCLSRSLTLQALLRAQGIPSDLKIGARTTGNQFQAHAWIECGGRPLNEGPDVYQRYAVFREAIHPKAKFSG